MSEIHNFLSMFTVEHVALTAVICSGLYVAQRKLGAARARVGRRGER